MCGITPLHIALGLVEKKKSMLIKLYKQLKNDKKAEEINKEFTDRSNLANVELATILFENIKNYPMLHSTPYIVKAIIEAI